MPQNSLMHYIKTVTGQAAFKLRSDKFSARQRSIFLLFDGVKSVDQILKMTAALGITRADVESLEQHGFIENVGDEIAPPGSATGAYVTSGVATPTLGSILKGEPSAPTAGTLPVTAVNPQAPEQAQPRAPTHQERFAQAWPLATQLTAGLGLRGFRLNLSIEKASGYDDLLKLLPSIQEAVGKEKCAAFERALKF